MTYEILDPFTHVHPGKFISEYQDWIFFTLLLFFFWAVVGIALHKKFPDSRHLRTLTTSTALILAVGTYYSVYKGWLHLDLQGFGVFGTILLFIIIFFILFGLMRGYGMHVSKALPITYTLFYIGMWTIAPNITDTIADIFPPLNGVMLLLFIYSVFKTITAFFKSSSSPKEAARALKHTQPITNEPEIDKEISEDKREMKDLKKKTMKLTKLEINNLDDIEHYIKQMLHNIEDRGNTLDQREIDELTKALRNIQKKEDILKKGSVFLDKQIYEFKTKHRKDISELEERLGKSKDKNQRKEIEEELVYQKKMLEAIDFMQQYESRIIEFINSFNVQLANTVQSLRGQYPHDALLYLRNALKNIRGTKHIYEKLKDFENYLIKLDKKTIHDLKEEKQK